MTMKPIYEPEISAHAYQRYRERFGDASAEDIEKHILTDKAREWISWGAIMVLYHNGLHIIAREGVVVSVVSDKDGSPFHFYTHRPIAVRKRGWRRAKRRRQMIAAAAMADE